MAFLQRTDPWMISTFLLVGLIVGFLFSRIPFSSDIFGKKDILMDNDPVKGQKDAPVTIVEFSDFQCSYCGRFVRETLPLISKKYIETGKVKLVFRDFPLAAHSEARIAALASECADDQRKFWEMHDLLFERVDEWAGNAAASDVMKNFAKELGLKSPSFDSCMDGKKHEGEIEKDFQDGKVRYKVSGTPTFFINGDLVTGAQPFAKFEEMIDNALNEG